MNPLRRSTSPNSHIKSSQHDDVIKCAFILVFILSTLMNDAIAESSPSMEISPIRMKLANSQNNMSPIEKDIQEWEQRIRSIKQDNITLSKEETDEIAEIENQLKSYQDQNNSSPVSLDHDQIQNILEKIEENHKNIKLSEECIRYLKRGDFENASFKINDITDKSKIDYIIEEAYENDDDRPRRIFLTGRNNHDPENKLLIFKALYKQMIKTNHPDLPLLLKIYNELLYKIINLEKISSKIKQQAVKLFSSVGNTTNEIVVNNMTTSLLNDHKFTPRDLGAQIQDACYPYFCYSSIMKKLVDTLLSKITVEEILDLVKSDQFCCRSDEYSIYLELVDTLLRDDSVDNGALLILVYRLYYIGQLSNELQKKIPASIDNIVKAKKVCIRNTVHNEYLFAGDMNYLYDDDRRHVFTLVKGSKHTKDGINRKITWKLEHHNNTFKMINTQYGENLFAGDAKWDDNRRYAMTWRKGGSVDGDTWIFIPSEDYVYIKNARNGEYLFADLSELRDSGRRNVFTFVPKNKTLDSRWEILDCSQD